MSKKILLSKIVLFSVCLFLSGCTKEDEILRWIKDKIKKDNDTSYWKQLPGKATDIGVGANGHVYITGIDTISETGGFSISKWTPDGWKLIPGAAIRIAVDTVGDPWVVNKSGLLFRRLGETWPWQQLPGTASDIGIGAEGSVYITDTTTISATGGYGILKWNGNNWDQIPGAAVRIAVDPAGDPWVVNKSGLIFRRMGDSWPWQQLPGKATDIGIGADGSVYITGTTLISETGGYGIFKWSGTDWQQLPGAAVNISVGPGGNPYFVNKSGLIFTSK